MNCCYIIYSKKANHYYVGASRDLLERIRKHNEKAYGSKAYTAIADDWQLAISLPVFKSLQSTKFFIFASSSRNLMPLFQRLGAG